MRDYLFSSKNVQYVTNPWGTGIYLTRSRAEGACSIVKCENVSEKIKEKMCECGKNNVVYLRGHKNGNFLIVGKKFKPDIHYRSKV